MTTPTTLSISPILRELLTADFKIEYSDFWCSVVEPNTTYLVTVWDDRYEEHNGLWHKGDMRYL
jgi:hypothetical protein